MKKSVKSNFIYSLGYNLINVLAPFIITPYVARVLGPENMGIYSYSYSIAYYFVLFAMLGVINYGNRTIAAVRDDRTVLSKTFWDIYYMQMFLSVVLTLIYVGYSFINNGNKAICFTLVFYVLSAMFDITWLFYGVENFRFILIRNFMIKLIDLICIFVFVKTSNDLFKYTLIMAVGFLLANLFMWTNVHNYVDKSSFQLKDSIKHLKPNFVLFIPVIAISIYNAMDKIMLGKFASMIQVGYYDNSEKIITIPQMIITALGTVMLPRISNLLATGEKKATKDYLEKSILFVAVISSACTFGIITVANEFIQLYLGSGYEACVLLLYLLMPCLIFKAYANVFRMQYLIPQKLDHIYIKSVCMGAVINFIINFLLIPRYYAAGACIGTIAAEIIVCVYQMVYVVKDQKIIGAILKGFVFQVIGFIMFAITNSVRFNDILFVRFIEKIFFGAAIFIVLSFAYITSLYIHERKKRERN